MKKRMMGKRYSAHAESRPDIVGMINKMQEQLVSLERKVDILIGGSLHKPAEVKSFPKPFQQPARTRNHGLARQDNSYRERILHKAICADCSKECEVPFKPSGDRPVYCKECFSKRKAGSPPKEKFYNKPKEAGFSQGINANKPQGGEKKKHAERKRPAGKRRRARV